MYRYGVIESFALTACHLLFICISFLDTQFRRNGKGVPPEQRNGVPQEQRDAYIGALPCIHAVLITSLVFNSF